MSLKQKYMWRAIHRDGTKLEEWRGAKYTDIKRRQLVQFQLIDMVKGKPHVVLHLKEGQQVIFRRRSTLAVNSRDITQVDRECVWLVGWQENKRGINTQMLFFVFQDGTIEVKDKFTEDHVLYHPVRFLPEEEVGR